MLLELKCPIHEVLVEEPPRSRLTHKPSHTDVRSGQPATPKRRAQAVVATPQEFDMARYDEIEGLGTPEEELIWVPMENRGSRRKGQEVGASYHDILQ